MPPVIPTLTVQVANGGSFRDALIALAPLGYWPLGDVIGTVAEDVSGNGRDGVYVGAPTLRQMGLLPEGGGAVVLDGATQKVTVASTALNLTGGPLTVIVIAKRGASVGGDAGLAGTGYNGVGKGYQLNWHLGGSIYFNIGTNSLSGAASYVYSDQTAHHLIVGTWDGTTAVNGIKLYLDGALVAQGTAASAVLDRTGFVIGQSPNNYFNGTVSQVAVLTTAINLTTVQALWAAASWTDISADLRSVENLTIRYGISGNDPSALLAGTGELSLALRNDLGNSVGTLGAYSPAHASKRSGWQSGNPITATLSYLTTSREKFRGRVTDIDPDAGVKGRRAVLVTANDSMRPLVETELHELALEQNVTEETLMRRVFAAMPEFGRPVALDLDAGIDTYPIAFDRVGSGILGATMLQTIMEGAQGLGFFRGDGTFVYQTRFARLLLASSYNFTDADLVSLEAPTSIDDAFNEIYVTLHRKAVDATPTSIVWQQTGPAMLIQAGQTVEFFTEYRDPSNTNEAIGATDVQAPVSGVDYVANAADDGSGVDRTSALSVSIFAWASTMRWRLTNTSGSVELYVTTLRAKGKRIRDLQPMTMKSISTQTYGSRAFRLNIPHHDDLNIGQGLADYIRAQRESIEIQIDGLSFIANQSAALMQRAIESEPGDRITITEIVTGLSILNAFVQDIELSVSGKKQVRVRYGLTPSAINNTLILDDAVYGVMDAPEAVLGYA